MIGTIRTGASSETVDDGELQTSDAFDAMMLALQDALSDMPDDARLLSYTVTVHEQKNAAGSAWDADASIEWVKVPGSAKGRCSF